MIVSEKSHQNLSAVYIQFLFRKRFEFNKELRLFLEKKREIQVIISMIMLTRSSEGYFNSNRSILINIYTMP